ncbi:J domain-containing protein [Synechococcus sp. RSCCF101]|uniref:DnaJ C-terminal domain-containing protein n=1 Tax=Synechococcus sp. RSCCF101 TaxID=2511069 RepID=UPI0012470C7A|nr:DnaJ C-terminal domain-containing protein [Synechococcus sp. RSCCF101]QEY31703.1 J domain-containing protein [Synechococcus sp. RSCCF101]
MSGRAQGGTDHWQVLGLSPDASAEALKRAFRAQARRWHPDLNGNDPVAEEQFKRVNEAYAVLTDPRRRRAWEEERGVAGTPGGAGAGPRDPFAEGFPHFEDYIAVVLGRARRSERGADPAEADDPGEPPRQAAEERARRPSEVTAPPPPSPPPVARSDDLVSQVDLSVEDALQGARVELTLPDGTVVEVWTPPLAGDGWRLRLAGVGPGGSDHFLELRVRTEEGLRIQGLRVEYDLELQPADAVLGCTVEVPTLAGPVRLRVPPSSSSGRLLRLRGRGLELEDGERGDQWVLIRIVVPDAISDAEEALYRRLQEVALEEA